MTVTGANKKAQKHIDTVANTMRVSIVRFLGPDPLWPVILCNPPREVHSVPQHCAPLYRTNTAFCFQVLRLGLVVSVLLEERVFASCGHGHGGASRTLTPSPRTGMSCFGVWRGGSRVYCWTRFSQAEWQSGPTTYNIQFY